MARKGRLGKAIDLEHIPFKYPVNLTADSPNRQSGVVVGSSKHFRSFIV